MKGDVARGKGALHRSGKQQTRLRCKRERCGAMRCVDGNTGQPNDGGVLGSVTVGAGSSGG